MSSISSTALNPFSLENLPAELARWVLPLPNGSYGPDLEYDNAFLQLVQAASGKPETQFEEAQSPDWQRVESLSANLLEQSRDLRVLLYWLEARLNIEGLSALPHGLFAFAYLVNHAWTGVNPPLDPYDDDPYARMSVIESMGRGGSFYQSLRLARLTFAPSVGMLLLKHFEMLQDTASYNEAEVPFSKDQLDQFLSSNDCDLASLHTLLVQTEQAMAALTQAFVQQLGQDQAPELGDLADLLRKFKMFLPPLPALAPPQTETVASSPKERAEPVFSASIPKGTMYSNAVNSRSDALKAIDMVCVYLENAEPTNPAQLLLKRARRLIDKNFLELVKDLAPDALHEVARIMGVDPADLDTDRTYALTRTINCD